MPIVLARVDDRLVHAQVVEGWLKAIVADHIVIVSDEVAADEIQKTMYSLSVPYGTHISCFSVDDAVRHIPDMAAGAHSLMLLMPSLDEALRLVRGGVGIKSLNVGGLHAKKGKKMYTPTVSLDDKDIALAGELSSAGVELETRVLPMHDRKNLFDVIKDNSGAK